MPIRAETIWPAAAVMRPVILSVAPAVAKRPPATVVWLTVILPARVEEPEVPKAKIAPWPERPEALLMTILFVSVTPPATWNWAALLRLIWPVLRAPEAVTCRMPWPPMLVAPVKLLSGLETMTVPVPTFVRPMLPVIFESIER